MFKATMDFSYEGVNYKAGQEVPQKHVTARMKALMMVQEVATSDCGEGGCSLDSHKDLLTEDLVKEKPTKSRKNKAKVEDLLVEDPADAKVEVEKTDE